MGSQPSSPHIVFAGGGTGGHLFPGVAVAEKLAQICPDAEITFVGTEGGIEARVIPETDFELRLVDVQPLKGGSLIKRVVSVASLPGSGWQARRLLKTLQTDVVVSLGGYAAGPITMVASLSGAATALMEQNSYPGLTNRLLSRFVDQAFLTFERTEQFLGKTRVSTPGNPVRQDLLATAEDFQYETPAEDGPFRILIIGGSGGAGSFNEHIPSWLSSMEELTGRLHVRHQAGRGRADEALPGYEEFQGRVEVVEFIDDMAEAYRWCDLLICRAGASTIAEVLILGIPAIYIPFPHAADDHQRANARSVVEAGAGVMIDDDEINSDRARNLLSGFMNNPQALQNLARRARSLARPQAGKEIADRLLEMAQS